jgi:flotillin
MLDWIGGHLCWVVGIALFVLLQVVMLYLTRYKRCPDDKLLVIWDTSGREHRDRVLRGGSAMAWPKIDEFGYISLNQWDLDLSLAEVLPGVASAPDEALRFRLSVSPDLVDMPAAAKSLVQLSSEEVRASVGGVIGERLAEAAEEFTGKRSGEIPSRAREAVEGSLREIGIRVHNVAVEVVEEEKPSLLRPRERKSP